MIKIYTTKLITEEGTITLRDAYRSYQAAEDMGEVAKQRWLALKKITYDQNSPKDPCIVHVEEYELVSGGEAAPMPMIPYSPTLLDMWRRNEVV